MRGVRLRLLPALGTLAAVLICLALGGWQVERLHWKEALIAQRQAALEAAPTSLPASLAAAQTLEWRRVEADGVFLAGKQFRVHAIAPGGDPGFALLAPLRLPNGDNVFVDRGFVPAELKGAETPPPGQIHVAGRLRLALPHKPNWFMPDNRPAEGQWFWIDLPAVARAAGLAEAAPYYILAGASSPPGSGWPKPDDTPPALPNNHLQYAITWFSLAAAALVIYVLSQRRGGA